MSPDSALLDTHTLIWTTEGQGFPGYGLSSGAIRAIGNADVAFVSYASSWEVAIKVSLANPRALRLSLPYEAWVERVVKDARFTILSIREEHLKRVATLPPHHGDPFDRLLVAQALVEGIPIVSADGALDAYGVRRVW